MHVCLILFPHFPILGFVLIREVLDMANRIAGQPLFSCRIRTVTGQTVAASDGTNIAAEAQDWEGAQGFDLVVLCAGPHPLDHLPMGLRGFLARAEAAGATLAGLDQGALILARLGLLDGREAVLPPDPDRTYPEVAQSERRHTFDRQRLTSTGGLATAEAMLDWIARSHGPALAARTGEALAHGRVAQASRSLALAARAGHGDPLMTRMTALMAAHLDAPLPLPQIADELDMRLKRLRLRCRKALHRTPAEVYLDLRLRRAAQLVEETTLSVAEIAAATGFASPSAFTRSYGKHFGKAPRAQRTLRTQREKTTDATGWARATEAARPSGQRQPNHQDQGMTRV
ncbi:GlxA family transcriptional regulator [Sagittula stellata]|uniref:Transcriptional regulator, AraC family protein n=1 Tax=Sagittula stellata (strain ATCC 700073 / DSM 11524 / E-37) TaxID=388399 RepID=A3K1T1_SAGS3|nr:helix-turn-helix domain-containing protein [Sagittula stellata]EBA08877.1 transcriptional regulator, AraC family protein [Sagittula stellata E-37]